MKHTKLNPNQLNSTKLIQTQHNLNKPFSNKHIITKQTYKGGAGGTGGKGGKGGEGGVGGANYLMNLLSQ